MVFNFATSFPQEFNSSIMNEIHDDTNTNGSERLEFLVAFFIIMSSVHVFCLLYPYLRSSLTEAACVPRVA